MILICSWEYSGIITKISSIWYLDDLKALNTFSKVG